MPAFGIKVEVVADDVAAEDPPPLRSVLLGIRLRVVRQKWSEELALNEGDNRSSAFLVG